MLMVQNLGDGGNGVDHWAAPALSKPDPAETVGACSPPGEDSPKTTSVNRESQGMVALLQEGLDQCFSSFS